jgi:hypothetical protein
MTDNRRPPANSHPPNTLTLYVSGPHGIPRTQAPQVHPHKAVTYTSALRLSRVHPTPVCPLPHRTPAERAIAVGGEAGAPLLQPCPRDTSRG